MKSHSTQAILGVGIIAFAVVTAALGMIPLAIGSMAILAFVAFTAQSGRLRDEQRLVYRPVYVRRHDVQSRVTSDD